MEDIETMIDRLSKDADNELMDDSLGNAYTFGWHALFSADQTILTEKLDKITVEVYQDYGSLMIAWKRLEDEWEAYAKIHGTD
jgi:hypothetical protein